MKRRGALKFLCGMPAVFGLSMRGKTAPAPTAMVWLCLPCSVGGLEETPERSREAMAAHHATSAHWDLFERRDKQQVLKGQIKRRRRRGVDAVRSYYAAWREAN